MAITATLSAVLVRELVRRWTNPSDSARSSTSWPRRADALRAIDLRLARGEQHAAIGMLAAGVAHEINNPLAYVSANLNHLRALWQRTPTPTK
jgi:C4-dicarboxylate-specific signal transduction histidine kinase